MVEFERHVLRMEKYARRDFVVDIPTARSVQLRMCLSANHRIECDGVLCLRFEILHIDLSRNGFVTIEHGGCAFANLNSLHPWTGDILHTKGLC